MIWQIYLNYDEDSLITYSNAGLLRRAKKSLDAVQLKQQQENLLTFTVEEAETQLSPTGLSTARCDCTAMDSCKHILASILWMQQHVEQFSAANSGDSALQAQPDMQPSANRAQDPADTDSAGTDAATSSMPSTSTEVSASTVAHAKDTDPKTDAATDPETDIETSTATGTDKSTETSTTALPNSGLTQVLAWPAAAIHKQLTKAERRLSFEIFHAWQDDQRCQIEILPEKICFLTDLSTNKIQLYPQAGFAGMLSDIDQHQKAVHLACLATLYQRHSTQAWPWPQDLLTAVQTEKSVELSAEDRELISELQALCRRFIQIGINHISKEMVLSLHLLNMQARAQSLPRLAAKLRQLHGLMQQYLQHTLQQGEEQIFDLIAQFYAYLAALSTAKDAQLKQLRGEAATRTQAQSETLQLIPLGCEWWQRESGAHGLSLCFWDLEQSQLIDVTQARANTLDRSFDQNTAQQSGIWGSPLEYLLEHQLQLSQIKTRNNGALSTSADSVVKAQKRFAELNIQALSTLGCMINDWQQLNLDLGTQSMLNPMPTRYVLLHFQSIEAPKLNELEQSFECRIIDTQQRAISLSLPIRPEYQRRIKQLQQLLHQDKAQACLARIEIEQQQIKLIPCSFILQEKKGLRIFSLDYHYVPAPAKKNVFELINGRIEKLMAQKKQWQNTAAPKALSLLLLQSQNLISYYANTGRAQFDPEDLQQLSTLAQQFQDLGLDVIAQSLQQGLKPTMPQQQLAHALLQWRLLLAHAQALQHRLPIETVAETA